MPRRTRSNSGGTIFHVLNRAAARYGIFETSQDYLAFLQVLTDCVARFACSLLGYCLMPNHWHLLLKPVGDKDLTYFMKHLGQCHTQRWHSHFGSVGTGPIYQGRYKCFPVQEDVHFLVAARYVERNPLRANLVSRAEDWPWSSLSQRNRRKSKIEPELGQWPLAVPANWTQWVNSEESSEELIKLRLSVTRERPFGSEDWQEQMVKRLGLESTMRPRGRPRKG